MVEAYKPELIVSLLDPDDTFPEPGAEYAGRHLRLCLHDVHRPGPGQIIPDAGHMEVLLAFLERWSGKAPILIHCRAGIGRSPASAFITACLHDPREDELEIARVLRRVAPLARPNGVLVSLADAALHRNGRMIAAIAETGRDLPWIEISEGLPFEMPVAIRPAGV